MSFSENANGMVMPVSPMYGGYGGNGGFGSGSGSAGAGPDVVDGDFREV